MKQLLDDLPMLEQVMVHGGGHILLCHPRPMLNLQCWSFHRLRRPCRVLPIACARQQLRHSSGHFRKSKQRSWVYGAKNVLINKFFQSDIERRGFKNLRNTQGPFCKWDLLAQVQYRLFRNIFRCDIALHQFTVYYKS